MRAWAFRDTPFPAGDDTLERIEEAVRSSESIVGVPFPSTDVILLLMDPEDYGGRGGHFSQGVMAIARSAGFPNDRHTIYHETARYYDLGLSAWFNEGGADFIASYTSDQVGFSSLEAVQSNLSESVRRCASRGFENIRQLVEDEERARDCAYPLGSRLLIRLLQLLGEDAMSAALGELYLQPELKGRDLSERDFYRTFLNHAPRESRDDFRRLYRRLHGGPYTAASYAIETAMLDYGYFVGLPRGWVEIWGEGAGAYGYRGSGAGGEFFIRSQHLRKGTTLDRYAEQVRDNLSNDWFRVGSRFGVLSFEKTDDDRGGEFYALRYRVSEDPMYCTLDVEERIFLADSESAFRPRGFRVRHQVCTAALPDLRWPREQIFDAFRIVERIDGYYEQFIDVDGITIKADENVRAVSMRHAARAVEMMMSGIRDDLRECLVDNGAGVAISPRGELITVLPEFHPQKGEEEENSVGLGAVRGQPISGVVEAGLLKGYLDVAIHEFGHAVMNLCFSAEDRETIEDLYDEAKESGQFTKTYGMTNVDEFFAELSASFFEDPYISTAGWSIEDERHEGALLWLLPRELFNDYLPDEFAFLEEIYGGGYGLEPGETLTAVNGEFRLVGIDGEPLGGVLVRVLPAAGGVLTEGFTTDEGRFHAGEITNGFKLEVVPPSGCGFADVWYDGRGLSSLIYDAAELVLVDEATLDPVTIVLPISSEDPHCGAPKFSGRLVFLGEFDGAFGLVDEHDGGAPIKMPASGIAGVEIRLPE